MIRLERTSPRCVQVSGALNSTTLHVLVKALSEGPLILDLSKVSDADGIAVRLLASVKPEKCTLVDCPTWLSLWIERLRQTGRELP